MAEEWGNWLTAKPTQRQTPGATMPNTGVSSPNQAPAGGGYGGFNFRDPKQGEFAPGGMATGYADRSISAIAGERKGPKEGQTSADILKAAISGYTQAANIGADVYRGMLDPRAGQTVVTGTGPERGGSGMDTWRYGSPSDIRRAQFGGGGGGVSRGAAAAPPGGPIPEFHFEGSLDLPEYSPPAEDDEFYNRKRSEFMGRGLRGLRSRTQEAIMSSKSIDNPQARRQFVRDALAGYGEGLEGVAAEAGREARGEAGRKRAEELAVYQANFKAESLEAQAAYDQDLNEAMMNWKIDAQNIQAGFGEGAGGRSPGEEAYKQHYGSYPTARGNRNTGPGYSMGRWWN